MNEVYVVYIMWVDIHSVIGQRKDGGWIAGEYSDWAAQGWGVDQGFGAASCITRLPVKGGMRSVCLHLSPSRSIMRLGIVGETVR